MEFKVITISLATHVLEQLHKYCDKTGQKQTDVIRQAVYEFLNNIYLVSPDIIECKEGVSNSDSNE